MKPKILVLDDEPDILQLFRSMFSGEDVELLLESDSDSALRRIMTDRPNVAIIDISLPNKSGLDVLREAKKIDPGLSVIIATGFSSTQYAIEAMKFGAYDYLTKPFEIRKIKGVVQKAFECNLLNRKVRYTKDRDHLFEED